MDSLTIFCSMVGFIGVFHRISQTIQQVKKNKPLENTTQATRDDWYCFFHLSDLQGSDSEPSTMAEQSQSTINDAQRRDQRRRQEANRLRLKY